MLKTVVQLKVFVEMVIYMYIYIYFFFFQDTLMSRTFLFNFNLFISWQKQASIFNNLSM